MAKTETKRHPGRRSPANAKTREKHEKLIKEAQAKRRKLEADLDKQMNVLANRCDKAMDDGVETQEVGDLLGVSRQMIYKLVRERVDGKPLGKARVPSRNGNRPGK